MKDKTMNEEQQILALEAALIACEKIPAIKNSVCDLFEIVSEHYSKDLETKYPTIGQYLKAQRMAVIALAENPVIFGAE